MIRLRRRRGTLGSRATARDDPRESPPDAGRSFVPEELTPFVPCNGCCCREAGNVGLPSPRAAPTCARASRSFLAERKKVGQARKSRNYRLEGRSLLPAILRGVPVFRCFPRYCFGKLVPVFPDPFVPNVGFQAVLICQVQMIGDPSAAEAPR
jgi:hypothetical protein